jgi:hypothetical protein
MFSTEDWNGPEVRALWDSFVKRMFAPDGAFMQAYNAGNPYAGSSLPGDLPKTKASPSPQRE